MIAVATATRLPLPDQSVDLVFGSPPYGDARTYGINADRSCLAWVDWMLDVTEESLRVCRGPVVWVMAGVTRNQNYRPYCEGLMWRCMERGITLLRPVAWQSNKAPTTEPWYSAAWEYVVAFKRSGPLGYFDWESIAEPPRYGYSGGFRQRTKSGRRPKRSKPYVAPARARPRAIIKTNVGGGHMGHILASEGEAPFPESLVEKVLLPTCPPGGTVLDPFSGSGTTMSVAKQTGRKAIAFDLRISQCQLTRRRCGEIQSRLEFAC